MKTLVFEWKDEGTRHRLVATTSDCDVATVTQNADGDFIWWSSASLGNSFCYETLDQAKSAAEESLGIVAVVQLRWVHDKHLDEYFLMLGERQLEYVSLSYDSWEVGGTACADLFDAVFQDAAEAMRAVEATYGITEPLPVEGEP